MMLDLARRHCPRRTTPMAATLLVAVLLVSAGCDDTVTVTFSAGCTTGCGDEPPPIAYEVSAASLTLPQELRDDTGDDARIGEIECGPMGMCPSSEESEVSVSCEEDDNVCDPQPTTIAEPVGGVIDFNEIDAELRGNFFTKIDEVEVLSVQYLVRSNTLTVEVPTTELHWGPAGASTVDPEMGVQPFGHIAPLAPEETRSGEMDIDAAGSEALSEHLVAGDRLGRARFFARTRVDLEAGGAWPEGSAEAAIEMRVRVRGSRL